MKIKSNGFIAPVVLIVILGFSVFAWSRWNILQQTSAVIPNQTATATTSTSTNTSKAAPRVANSLSDDEIKAMAGDIYANGLVPLGDYRYTTTEAKQGYVYLCNVRKDNPGSMVVGPWVHGSLWNFLEKVSVNGAVSWPQAKFSMTFSGSNRILSSNSLPTNHTTGVFPVAQTDDAYKYDSNPNTISSQTILKQLPRNPTYSKTPYCMGGEVGVMLNGVPLFNAFDAGLRDAPAHELQDSCDGHPQGSGEYHYHSLSACLKNADYKTVIGYAYDGFPITGSQVTKTTYLTTKNLDECHGITSEIVIDGEKKISYHYVMTKDFPYSASCFRGKPVSTGPSVTPGGKIGGQVTAGQPNGKQPPQEAIEACNGKQTNDTCTVNTPDGHTITGTCKTPPNASLACVPTN